MSVKDKGGVVFDEVDSGKLSEVKLAVEQELYSEENFKRVSQTTFGRKKKKKHTKYCTDI